MKKLFMSGLILLFSFTVFAGSQQVKEARFSPEEIAKFAKNVEKYAAKQGARAFIIARVGHPANKLPKGFEFTHTAIAVYSQITLSNGEKVKGYAIHNLYQSAKDSGKSSLVTDYPVDFFWGAHELKAGIIIPTPELQTKIVDVISSGQNKLLHNSNYSLVANPFNKRYQNCTEHTLDIINAAIYQNYDIDRLKTSAKAYFEPQKVHVSRIKLTMGSLFSEGVSLKDHERSVKTASFSAIARYLESYELALPKIVFQPETS